MKIKQLLNENDVQSTVQAWFDDQLPPYAQVAVKLNSNNTVDIVGKLQWYDFFPAYPANFPKINNVEGNFSISYGASRSCVPAKVSGEKVEIWGGADPAKSQWKTSELPRSNGAVLYTQGPGELSIDDPSVLETYSRLALSFSIVDGIERIPTDKPYDKITIKEPPEKIPASLRANEVRIEMGDTRYKRDQLANLKNIQCDQLSLITSTNTPILALLAVAKQCKNVTIFVTDSHEAQQIVRDAFEKCKTGDLDILDFQDALIDGGLTRMAK